jgi:hypothetical protein
VVNGQKLSNGVIDLKLGSSGSWPKIQVGVARDNDFRWHPH